MYQIRNKDNAVETILFEYTEVSKNLVGKLRRAVNLKTKALSK